MTKRLVDESSLISTAVCASLAVGSAVAAYSLLFWNKTSRTNNKCIYLDYNGTTPIYKDVLQAMMPYLTEHYGNPSSSHAYGKAPRQAIDQARRQLLTLLGCSTSTSTSTSDQSEDSSPPLSTIWFTGCGTESDNMAIQLAIQSQPKRPILQQLVVNKYHIVTSNVEHPAVELYLEELVKRNPNQFEVTYVPVDKEGRVSAKDMIAAFRSNTILVTLMLANNESGALQPVRQVAQACRKRGILMHTDAAQAAGKVSVSLEDLGYPDMISLVGHKLGATKGMAALYVRDGCLTEHGRGGLPDHGVMLIGGGQEFGQRAGTENTPAIVGFGYAAEKAYRNLAKNAQHMERLRARLLSNLQSLLGESNVRANGPSDPNLRLPNTLSVGLRNVHSGDLLADIGNQVAASAGATCHSSAGAVSSVLMAMGVPGEFSRGTLRLSLGPSTTARDVDRAAKIIATGVKRQLEK